MTTEYEPGRVYSGIVDGKRRLLFRDYDHWHWIEEGYLMGGDNANHRVTDVRGPLVVLDLPDLDDVDWRTIATDLRNRTASADAPYARIADQIEEQTRPPLQVGWHEVEDCHRPLYWDGDHWSIGPWAECPTTLQGYLSTHYIGPGSDQS